MVVQTLDELDRINQWLGGNNVTLKGIKALVGPEVRHLRLADMGCGSGTILKLIADWGRKHKISLEMVGIDANESIVSHAPPEASGGRMMARMIRITQPTARPPMM